MANINHFVLLEYNHVKTVWLLPYLICHQNQNDSETILSHQSEAVIMSLGAWIWSRLAWDLSSHIWFLYLLPTGRIIFTLLTVFQQCLYLLLRNLDSLGLFLSREWFGVTICDILYISVCILHVCIELQISYRDYIINDIHNRVTYLDCYSFFLNRFLELSFTCHAIHLKCTVVGLVYSLSHTILTTINFRTLLLF